MTEAYDILSDPLKREFYDVNGFYTDGVLEPNAAETSWGFSFQGFNFSRARKSPTSATFLDRSFGRGRRDPERGQDLEHPDFDQL